MSGEDKSGLPPEPEAETPAVPEDEAPAVPEEPTPAAGEADEAPDEDTSEPEQEAEAETGAMPLTAHLRELRSRLLRAVVAAFVGFLICYPFAEQIFNVLMEPMVRVLENSNFIYTYPAEAFFTYMKVSFVAGIFLTSPYIFYQLWQFVAPGLYEHERKLLIPIAVLSAVFFTSGACFGYFIVFPVGFEFFASYSSETIVFMPKLDEYLSFCLKLLFAFGLIFEMPLFVLFLARLGIVTAAGMRRVRKWAILGNFVVAAILTPPDVVSQCLMAAPLLILYEVSVIVARIFGKNKPAPEPEETDEADETATDA